ncbi:MAG: ABC transporter ATP-binding protein [Bacillota bacterium]|nr:ABC transporter ATP-binding protein [Bacillota bacterium]
MLEIKNLDFAYGPKSKTVLKNISCQIEPGHLTAILGNNGAGKSTLLKCLSRIHKISGGQILLDGQDIYKLSRLDLAKKIAYVGQKTQASHTMVFDTVLLGRRPYIKWEASSQDKNIVSEILQKLNLSSYASSYVDQVSGGELQKIVLARALAQEPKYLLLDEPTSNLDPYNQQEILKIVREICSQENIGGLIVIHDLNLAIKYCDRFLLIKDSQVYGYGGLDLLSPQAIKDLYKIDVDIVDYKGQKLIVAL